MLHRGKKDLDIVIEIKEDTIFVKTNIPVGGDNKLKYNIIDIEKKRVLNKLLININKDKIKPKYSDKGHCIYQYGLKFNGITTSLCSESYPPELNNLIMFFRDIIDESLSFKEIDISKDCYKELKILKINGNNNTLSSIETYFIWKKLVFSSKKELLKKNNTQRNYTFMLDYPVNYKGNRISNLTTDNLKRFYYKLNNQIYSFELDSPITIK